MDMDWIGPVSDPYPIQSEPYMQSKESKPIQGLNTASYNSASLTGYYKNIECSD
jgi:hypothetical protein